MRTVLCGYIKPSSVQFVVRIWNFKQFIIVFCGQIVNVKKIVKASWLDMEWIVINGIISGQLD